MSDTQAPPLTESDLSGRRLGDYQLIRRLGRGAMADVYLAQQESLRRQIAIKILKTQLALDEIYVRRFHLEAQAAASLVHANIVQIHDVGCIDGVHFIAQEYIQGVNLREYVARHGPPDAKLAVRIMRQVAAALSRAAEQSIVHRDIKPENIMLAKTGEVKVADFGLARTMREGAQLDLTQVGITMGTPLYMSPEQVEGRPLDPRSDIYSLGVTCYYMLAGEAPFRGDTALSVALQHLKAQPARLETLRTDLPPGLCRIVHQMLAKDPDARYRTPRDLLKDLRSLDIDGLNDDDENPLWTAGETQPIGHLRLDATQQLDAIMRTQSLLRPSRHWPKLVAAAAVVAFVVGAAAGYSTRPEPLLDDVGPSAPQTADLGTAEAQFRFAQSFPSKDAWWAVTYYHGENHSFARIAQEEEARFHLEPDGDKERARELLRKLEADRNDRYRAFGIAGQAILLRREQRKAESDQKLAELFKLVGGQGPEQLEAFFPNPTRAERFLMEAVSAVVLNSSVTAEQANREAWDLLIEQLQAEGQVDNSEAQGLN